MTALLILSQFLSLLSLPAKPHCSLLSQGPTQWQMRRGWQGVACLFTRCLVDSSIFGLATV